MRRQNLSKSLTEADFVNGYWYATELKAFARSIGISPVSKLRKDELEAMILRFLQTGEIVTPTHSMATPGRTDCELGLSRELPVVRYKNNRETKEFLRSEAINADPDFRPRSGAMYRLNRWREQQVNNQRSITYGDLVDEYATLCKAKGRFPAAPSGRYVNFLSEFFGGEESASRQQALHAWHELKQLPIPKTYAAWKLYNASQRIRQTVTK